MPAADDLSTSSSPPDPRRLRRVTLMVQLEQPVEHLHLDRGTDRVADPLGRLVEVMMEIQLVPAVGSRNGMVQPDVVLAQRQDVGRRLRLVVDPVVCLREPLVAFDHQAPTMLVECIGDAGDLLCEPGMGKGLEAIGWCVPEVGPHGGSTPDRPPPMEGACHQPEMTFIVVRKDNCSVAIDDPSRDKDRSDCLAQPRYGNDALKPINLLV